MGLSHVLCHSDPDVISHIGYISQEARCNTQQGLSRPAMEPVKLGAVDQRRELASTDAELVANRTEAQHHMEVAADLQV